jgi:hypothetical protein
MNIKPHMAKAHSKLVADEYLRLGWTLCSESRMPGYDEPAEYYFEWRRADEPVSIDWAELNRKHESA